MLANDSYQRDMAVDRMAEMLEIAILADEPDGLDREQSDN